MIIQVICARFFSIHALLATKTVIPDADDIAKAAISSNKHISKLVIKVQITTKSLTVDIITLGEMDEAIDYINHNIKPWIRNT